MPTDTDDLQLKVMSAGRPLLLHVAAGRLVVATGKGEVLDPEAAQVLVALGGDAPAWLSTVEGLRAVYDWFRWNPRGLELAADALGRSWNKRALMARESEEPAVLLALAGAGQPQVVRNPQLTPRMWELITSHRDEKARAKALTLAETLPPALATSADREAKVRVARNAECPADVLEKLARFPDSSVRCAVARNQSASRATFDHLTRFGDNDVKVALASNPRTPPRMLQHLAVTRSPVVRMNLARNPSTPRTTLRSLMWDGQQTRYTLAGRDDLSSLTLSWIERYSRRTALYTQTCAPRLKHNPNCSKRLVRRIERLEDNQRQLDERSRRPDAAQAASHDEWIWALRLTCLTITFCAALFTSISAGWAAQEGDLVASAAFLAITLVLAWIAIRLAQDVATKRPPFRAWRPPPPRQAVSIAFLALVIPVVGVLANAPPFAAFCVAIVLLGFVSGRFRKPPRPRH